MTLKQWVIKTLNHTTENIISIPKLTNLLWQLSNYGKELVFYNTLLRTVEQGHVTEPKAELQNRIYTQYKNWKEVIVDKSTKPYLISLNNSFQHKSVNIKNKKLHFSFQINFSNLNDFIDYWETKYIDKEEYKYDTNINIPLTEKSRLELFEWKNGSVISKAKIESIKNNYPLVFNGNKEQRYLNYKENGGAIWNIFYLHILDTNKYPIYDQHTYRAMIYLQTKKIIEISNNDKKKYESYIYEYIPFVKSFNNTNHRKIDKALFAFGQFLKIANKYIK